VRLSVQVLTPPRRAEPNSPQSAGIASPFRYLVDFAPMLFAALAALSQADTLEIVRLHGQLPHLAAALLPICDVFGDMPAGSPSSTDAADDLLMYSIFSQAFLLLVRHGGHPRVGVGQQKDAPGNPMRSTTTGSE
jgi:hypothetical protein